MCADAAAGTWFYHTQSSNHLDQNINLNKHKLSLLVNDCSVECNVSQHKKNYHETIHDGAIRIKGTIALRCRHEKPVCRPRFLTQAKDRVSD